MPWSHTEGKTFLCNEYDAFKPETVVEIGPGAGMYGNWMRQNHRGHWTGIEAWEPYVAQFDLKSKYDVIRVEDAREADLPEADLYICGDVLEHMTRNEAVALIERIKRVAKHLFVSIPIIEYHQGAIEGNPFEEHQYHWGFEEMKETLDGGLGGVTTWQGNVIGAYHWNSDAVMKPAPAKAAPKKRAPAKKAAPKKAA